MRQKDGGLIASNGMENLGATANPFGTRCVSADCETLDRQSAVDGGKIYGLKRLPARGGVSTAWVVGLRRQGRIVDRCFKDSAYGSSDASFAQAIAFRDAILDALPPMTNREGRMILRSDNTSGFAGIYRSSNGGRQWIAYFTRNGKARTKGFSVLDHGNEGARELAIEQRREWIAELDPAFRTADPFADAKAHDRFSERLDRVPDDAEACRLPLEEIDAALRDIGARFDALRPHRLWLTVRLDAQDRLRGLATYSAGGTTRRLQNTAGTRSRTLGDAMRCALAAMERMVGELCGAERSSVLMAERCEEWGGLTHDTLRRGVHVTVFLPPPTRSAESYSYEHEKPKRRRSI